MSDQRPEPLEYARPPEPYVYMAMDYVTATINGIVYFFVVGCGTTLLANILARGKLPGVVILGGQLLIPLAVAVLQFRAVLRDRKRLALRKREAQR